MKTLENKYQACPKVFICVLLSLGTVVHYICSTFSMSSVPLDLIMQTTKHLKRQTNHLGNQLELVPLYDITRIQCCTQGKHKSSSVDTSVTLMVTEGSSPITSVNKRDIWTRLILV